MHQKAQNTRDLVIILEFKLSHVISLVTLPILLVFVAFVNKVTLLLHLVVVDGERLAIDLMRSVLALRSRIRSLEANESKRHLSIFLLEKFERFDFTVGGEDVAEVVFGRLLREVLHVQVAALLGAFVLECFVFELFGTLGFFEGRLDVESLAFDYLVVHSVDSGLSTFRSVLAVSLLVGTIADKG